MAIAKPVLPKPTAAQLAAFEALQAHAAAAHPAPPASHPAPTAAQIAAFVASHPSPFAAHPAPAHAEPPHVVALVGHTPPHHG
jgi:hypothetical protein